SPECRMVAPGLTVAGALSGKPYPRAPSNRSGTVVYATGSNLTVAAVLTPGERQRVDAAGNGVFAVLHRDSVPDAGRVVRERSVDAVLVSVHRCEPEQIAAVGRLVRDFPGIPTVALLSQHNAGASQMLLRHGTSRLPPCLHR